MCRFSACGSRRGELAETAHEPKDTVGESNFMMFARFVIGCVLFMWHLFDCYVLNTWFKAWRFKNIEGEIALVTGGGGGIGRLLCLELAHHGAIIVIWDIDQRAAEETAELVRAAGKLAHAYQCDVSSSDSVRSVASLVREEVGPVSILVNNAGVVSGGRLSEQTDEAILRNFNVNTLAHFWTIRAFLSDMQQANHGNIVTISSMAGLIGVPRLPGYCASKFAACGIAEALAMELRADGFTGIHSTVICPYFTSTGMFNGVKGRIPMLQPEHVARATVEAILLNEGYVILPRFIRAVVPIKFLLPAPCAALLSNAFGVTDCMSTFDPHRRKEHSA